MITVMDIKRTKTAIIHEAYNVSYEKKSKSLWTLSFTIDANDPKIDKIKQLGYVEVIDDVDDEYIGLYKIMPKQTIINESTNEVTYSCTHVLCTLVDTVLFGYHEIPPNTKTVDSINYLLSKQRTKHWKLGKCDFNRYFQYSWEHENGLLDPLWSIATPLDEEYVWTWDTTSYPWTINLVRPEKTPVCRIREGHNLIGFTIDEDATQVINRIYPVGEAEGVNGMTIRKVHPQGLPYVENKESIDAWGLTEYIWKDGRYTNDKHLYDAALSLLKDVSKLKAEWTVDAVDLIKAIHEDDVSKLDKLRVNTVVRLSTEKYGQLDLMITSESKSDIFGDPGEIQLELDTKPRTDLSVDINRRVEINETYSQGQTSLLNFDKGDNCDDDDALEFKIYIDDDMVHVNTCELTYETSAFRAYSKATKGGGGTTKTTSGGGASVNSSTTSVDGQSTQTSTANGSHRHKMFVSGGIYNGGWDEHINKTTYWGHDTSAILIVDAISNKDIYTAEAADNHQHSVTTPAHQHQVTVNVPAHTHDLTLPDHTHDILYGIHKYSSVANKIVLSVDGNTVSGTDTRRERFDLVPYMNKDNTGNVTRGWHTIKMQPNDLCRVEAQITMRVFIKSHLGGVY